MSSPAFQVPRRRHDRRAGVSLDSRRTLELSPLGAPPDVVLFPKGAEQIERETDQPSAPPLDHAIEVRSIARRTSSVPATVSP